MNTIAEFKIRRRKVWRMPQFIALLRGVNVGNTKRFPMADFRALLADLGYAHENMDNCPEAAGPEATNVTPDLSIEATS